MDNIINTRKNRYVNSYLRIDKKTEEKEETKERIQIVAYLYLWNEVYSKPETAKSAKSFEF